MKSFKQYLNEKLMTFGKQAYPKFGNVVILAGGAGCYPAGTEFLSHTGWKKIEDYVEGDLIMEVDKDTLQGKLSKPISYIELPADQFFKFSDGNIEFTTSKEHKHLVISGNNTSYEKTTLDFVMLGGEIYFNEIDGAYFISDYGKNKIRIEGSGQLSKDDIERMKREAEVNAESDKIERENAEKLNSADSLVFQTEKFVSENADKLSTDDKASLEEKIQNLKTAFTEKRVADLDNLSTELNNVLHPITSKMYENQSQPEQDNTSTSSSNTEDVEYEEVK